MSGNMNRAAALTACCTLTLVGASASLVPAGARAAPANAHLTTSTHTGHTAAASGKPKKHYPAPGLWRTSPSGGVLYNGADYSTSYDFSYVPRYRKSPPGWEVEIYYANNTNSDITLTCTAADSDPSNVSEDVYRHGNSTQYVATNTSCSDNPGGSYTLPAGGYLYFYADFQVVPRLKNRVDINWSAFNVGGTSNVVNPWGRHVKGP